MKKCLTGLIAFVMLLAPVPSLAHEGNHDKFRNWDGKKTPKLELTVTKDAMSGYNVRIKTTGFKWSPQRASKAHNIGEGHAHIYVNGIKVGRVYSQWYHLSVTSLNLKPGTHIVKVDLNGNDHIPYMYKGKMLADTATIKIP